MGNARLDEAQARIKIAKRNTNNLRYADDTSSVSAIRVVSSAYLRLLIFLLAILVPACASSSPACQISQLRNAYLFLINVQSCFNRGIILRFG